MTTDAASVGIQGVEVIPGDAKVDHRGSFLRLFGVEEHGTWWDSRPVAQVNLSTTAKTGTIRGMHYDLPPVAAAKLVRCIRGAVFDVVVDLRPDSSTFLQWHGVELSSERATGLFIPEGCAHGFQVLREDSELVYVHSADYRPEHEGVLGWADPLVSIAWPLPAVDLSERDASQEELGGRDEAFARFQPFVGLVP